MAESVAADHPFVRRELPPEEGRAFFAERGQPFKVEILDDLAAKAKADGAPMPPVSVYEHGAFVDLCKGPHVESTGKLGPFKLLAVAGAYWRGDEKRPMLQRIYGTVWPTQEELDQYLWRRARRRRSATTAGSASSSTCTASTTCQPGLGLLAPEGPDDLADARRRDARAPGCAAATRRSARRSSSTRSSGSSPGHWDLYDANMFRLESEGHDFALKPMNCPESTFIYRSKVRSYRDLPLRLNEYGRLHRNERSGTLSAA